MSENFEDPSKKRRLDEDGTASAFADSTADSRKEKLEMWLKPLNNEQLLKLLLDMYVGSFYGELTFWNGPQATAPTISVYTKNTYFQWLEVSAFMCWQ